MDRREQIAHLAATREEEMLLLRVCEKLDTAMQRDIPAATNFLSQREQMLVCEVLRGAPVRSCGASPYSEGSRSAPPAITRPSSRSRIAPAVAMRWSW